MHTEKRPCEDTGRRRPGEPRRKVSDKVANILNLDFQASEL